MKRRRLNNKIAVFLVTHLAFSSVLSLMPQLQSDRTGNFLTYAQIKTTKQAATTEVVNETEHVPNREAVQQTQGQITKTSQDQPMNGWELLRKCVPFFTIGMVIVLIVTAWFIYGQFRATRKSRQQEVFMLLVSELNKIPFRLEDRSKQKLAEKDKLDLINKLHNYLDGVADVIAREGNPKKLQMILKKIKKKERKVEKKKEKLKQLYWARLLMWYKNLQIYYRELKPEPKDLPSHRQTKDSPARRDPHMDENNLVSMDYIPSEWFDCIPKEGHRREEGGA